MRVCVYGAGAVGGHIAGRLAHAGADVSVVARGAQLAAIRADGLLVHSGDGDLHAHVRASDDPAELGAQDAVIVTVKAPALPAVAGAIAPLLGRDTPVVFAMNGIPWWYFHKNGGPHDGRRLPLLDPQDGLRHAVGPHRAAGGVVYSGCTVIAPGVVSAPGRSDRLVFGMPDGRSTASLDALAQRLTEGGMRTDITPAIRDEIWAKLLINLGSGPFAVLTAAPPAGYGADPAIRDAVGRIYREGLEVARALGCAPEFDLAAAMARTAHGTHRPSILQDLDLGRPMEIDGIYTIVQELACLAGVETPTLDLMVALMKARARSAGLYGS